MNAIVLEKELAARSTGQRVTLDDVNNAIVEEHYFTGSQGALGARIAGDSNGDHKSPSLALLTFCVLVLKNGFTVTGQSACADPTNYKQDIGERIARQDAVNKIWPLLGYSLRERLCGAPASASEPDKPEAKGASDEEQYQLFEGVGAVETKTPDTSWLTRLKQEEAEVRDRFMKLAAFIEGSHHFELLPKDAQQDLREQLSYMRGYKMILERRIVKAGILNPLV